MGEIRDIHGSVCPHQPGLRCRISGWPTRGRDKLVHKLQAFGRDLYGHRGDAREVATGSIEARDEAATPRIATHGLTKRASARDCASTSCRYPHLLAHELLGFPLGSEDRLSLRQVEGRTRMQLPLHIDSASRVSLRQQLVDQLRQMIVDGLLAPREPERTLSRRGPI
jgi:hypothetical protein